MVFLALGGLTQSSYIIVQCVDELPLMDPPLLLPLPPALDANMLAITDISIETLSEAQAHATTIRRAFSIAMLHKFHTRTTDAHTDTPTNANAQTHQTANQIIETECLQRVSQDRAVRMTETLNI